MSNAPDRDQETLALFLEESQEALQRMDQLLVDAEKGKPAADLMGSLFRDIHTMKGSASFLAFEITTRLAHVTEDLLSKLRDGVIEALPAHFSLIMSSVDYLRQLLDAIKSKGDEPAMNVDDLIKQLREAQLESAVASSNKVAQTASVEPATTKSRKTKAAAPVAAEVAPPPAATAIRAAEETTTSNKAAVESADSSVRVNVAVLDKLMNLIGELVLARNQMVQIVRNSRDANVNAQAACQRLNLVTSDLQEQVMKTRMQPVARVFEKIPRMIRDLCQQTGKHVNPIIEGNATELDKALVEAIRDPVLHIVRNAIDHGVEHPEDRIRAGKSAIGKLLVRASHEGGAVTIEIKDDGKGMDPAKLRAHAISKGILTEAQAERLSDREALDLVFKAGFSTAATVTDISGRGVGMDVVRTHVERAGGQVEIDSVVGKGTSIRLKMPLTLAIIPALLVGTGSQRFAIPQVNLLELVYLNDQHVATAIEQVRGSYIYRLRGEVLPLVFLNKVLNVAPSAAEGIHIVVVSVGAKRYGMVVEEVFETEEIVIKPLSGQLKRVPAYSGATVLGDGGVALILEVAGIAAMTGIDVTSRANAENAAAKSRRNHSDASQPHVIFTSGEFGRCAVPLAMVSRLERLPVSTLEVAGGAEVVQYRNNIMPIVRPEAVVNMGATQRATEVQALIVFDFGRMVGMAVNEIVDVVDVDREHLQEDGDGELILGRTVVLGHTTLLLDVYGIVRRLAPQFIQERRQFLQRPRVLLVDYSSAMRSATSTYLNASGVSVVEAPNMTLALQILAAKDSRIDALVTDLELPDGGGVELISSAKRERPDLPCIVWTMQEGLGVFDAATLAGARHCISKLAREDLVAELERAGVLQIRRSSDTHPANGNQFDQRSVA